MTFGEKAYRYFRQLHPDFRLPKGVDALLPFASKDVQKINRQFYSTFYNDTSKRRMILGINPGRLGAGVTGIAFTDPVRLEKELHISNPFEKKPELSSEFIYAMIHAFGGVTEFYNSFYITSVCPIGFICDGKNLNFYDNRALQKAADGFIRSSIKQQLEFGIDRSVAFCLGEGKNYNYLKSINEKDRFFEKIIPLAHPRFIMQYRRKHVKEYIARYLSAFEQ